MDDDSDFSEDKIKELFQDFYKKVTALEDWNKNMANFAYTFFHKGLMIGLNRGNKIE